MNSDQLKQHKWLHRFVGDWEYQAECRAEPAKPPMKWGGTESVRSVGGLWIVAEGRGDMPGIGGMTAILTLGFDSVKGRFVGTWVASVMDYMWVYDGSLDSAGRVLSLEARGPNPSAEGKIATFVDAFEFKSSDHRVQTSSLRGDDGTWTEFMRAEYRRKG